MINYAPVTIQRLLSVSVFLTFWLSVSVYAFTSAPINVALPGLFFFVIFAFLPSLAAWVIIQNVNDRKIVLALLVAVAAFVTFVGIWLLQLYAIVGYAVTQPKHKIEGLLNNFYVFNYQFLWIGMKVALLVLVVTMAFRRQIWKS